jgi:hypothetical protein
MRLMDVDIIVRDTWGKDLQEKRELYHLSHETTI